LSMGTTAMVARRVGEGNVPAASKVALQAILIGIGSDSPPSSLTHDRSAALGLRARKRNEFPIPT